MPLSNVGKTMTLEAGKIYIVLSENEADDVEFGVIDTLDYEKDGHKFLACMARGMLEQAARYPVETIDMGVHGFDRDYAEAPEEVKEIDQALGLQPIESNPEFKNEVQMENVVTAEGNVVPFPKTQGNA